MTSEAPTARCRKTFRSRSAVAGRRRAWRTKAGDPPGRGRERAGRAAAGRARPRARVERPTTRQANRAIPGDSSAGGPTQGRAGQHVTVLAGRGPPAAPAQAPERPGERRSPGGRRSAPGSSRSIYKSTQGRDQPLAFTRERGPRWTSRPRRDPRAPPPAIWAIGRQT